MAHRQGEGGYQYFGTYAACPTTVSESPHVEALWRAWRTRAREGHEYDDNLSPEGAPHPISVEPAGPPATQPIDGVVYRVRRYYAYFPGCTYWATRSAIQSAWACSP